MLPEVRVNALTGDRVIVAPARAGRPGAAIPSAAAHPPADRFCPFCPGNESETPEELYRIPSRSAAGPGWQVRVFGNKYPVFVAEEPRAPFDTDAQLYETEVAIGRHEVIVETPAHDQDLTSLGNRALLDVFRAYRARFAAAATDPRIRHIVVFRNQGALAQASLAHPHSQLAALAFVPKYTAAALERSKNYFAVRGRNLLVDIATRETASGSDRLIEMQARFVSLVPFAPAHEYEIWVVPRFVPPRFDRVDDESLLAFATVLRNALKALERGLGGPDYNYVLHTPPLVDGADAALPWYVQIIPRLTPVAGFELGLGVQIVINAPEAAARRLREAARG